jgi:hypothetical protein
MIAIKRVLCVNLLQRLKTNILSPILASQVRNKIQPSTENKHLISRPLGMMLRMNGKLRPW